MNNPSVAQHALVKISPAVMRVHDELLTHNDLQFDFPKFVPPQTPDWIVALGKFLSVIGPHLKYPFWVAIIGGAIVLVFLIGRAIMRYVRALEKKAEAPATMPEWRPAPKVAQLLLRDADALAAQGKFTEAVHLLLLRSIQDIDERSPRLLKPALTSREIGALDQLPGAAREAFIPMARVVERALFAGREVGASDFAQCRQAYERFVFPPLWAAA